MRLLSSRAVSRRFALVLALGLLAGCGESDAPDDDLTAIHAPEIARIVPATAALAGAHIPTLDPASMNDAEIKKALGTGPHCEFRYTSAGDPVLAWEAPPERTPRAVVKLNGYLVMLMGSKSTNGGLVLVAEQMRVSATLDRYQPGNRPANERQEEATVVFEVGSRLRAGYRGYYKCVE